MTDRIIDISDFPARLSVRHRQVVIDRKESGTAVPAMASGMAVPAMNHGQDAHATTLTSTVPIEDLAVLVVAQMQVTYTHPVLAAMQVRPSIDSSGSDIDNENENDPP